MISLSKEKHMPAKKPRKYRVWFHRGEAFFPDELVESGGQPFTADGIMDLAQQISKGDDLCEDCDDGETFVYAVLDVAAKTWQRISLRVAKRIDLTSQTVTSIAELTNENTSGGTSP